MSAINKPGSVLDDFYRPLGSLFSQGFPTRLVGETDAWLPAVDIRREDNSFLIEMDVPGFSPDDIEVEAHDNVLTIQGERDVKSETAEDNFIRRERRYGKFVRRFSLPPGAAVDDIGAQVKDGVLHVRVPNAEASTPKKIAVD